MRAVHARKKADGTAMVLRKATKASEVIAARKKATREISKKTAPRVATSTSIDSTFADFRALTLQRIRGIMNSTRTTVGDLTHASQYADMIYLEDSHVRSTLDTHISSIVGHQLVVEDVSDDPADKRAAALVRLCMDNVQNLEGAMRNLISAHWSGQAFAEIQWASVSVTEGNKEFALRKPHKIIPVLAKKWRIQLVPADIEKGRTVGEYKYVLYDQGRFYNQKNLGFLGVDVDDEFPNTFIIHSPESNIAIHQRGLWRAAAFLYFQKKAMEAYHDAGAERFAWPFVYAVGPQDMSDESMESILDGLQDISQGTNAVFEAGTTVHSLEMGNAAGADALFNSRIDQINASYSKLILGSTLVVEEGDSGSRALGETQQVNKVDRATLEALQLCATLKEQLVRPIIEENAHLFPEGLPKIPSLKLSLASDIKQAITPDVQQYFTINEIRTSRGYSPLEGPEGEEYGRPDTSDATTSMEGE